MTDLNIPFETGPLSALVDTPKTPRWVYVLAHSAGAGMRHAWLQDFATRMVARDVAVLRYNFPYMDAGKNRVDSPDVATAAVRAAVEEAGRRFPGVPVVAGGKSFGGRMTSEAQARAPLPGVIGLASLGFPLHPPDKPGTSRAEHLDRVKIPMLFLQGTRDEFAQLPLLEGVAKGLPTATVVLVNDGDHSFKTRKKISGKSESEVMDGLADDLMKWASLIAY